MSWLCISYFCMPDNEISNTLNAPGWFLSSSYPFCSTQTLSGCLSRSISFELKYESAIFTSMSNFIIETDNYILPMSIISPNNTFMKSFFRFLNFSRDFFFSSASSSINYLLMIYDSYHTSVHIFCLCLQNMLCTVVIYLTIYRWLVCDTAHCETRSRYCRAHSQKHLNLCNLDSVSWRRHRWAIGTYIS